MRIHWKPLEATRNTTETQMDYNLKKENRKKFQDKSKLKRHHKKDYSKVVREGDPIEEREPERVREYDIEGNPILYDDEELDLQGNIVLKGSTNDFRYKEQLLDMEVLEDKYDIDFNKVIHSDEILKRAKGPKQMSSKELLQLEIVDADFSKNSQQTVEEHTYIPQVKTAPKLVNKTPQYLKKDEEFLDDLL